MAEKNENNGVADSLRLLEDELDEKTRLLLNKIKKIEITIHDIQTKIIILENKNIDKLLENLYKLENRINTLEVAQGGHEQNWKTLINFVVQVVWVVMAAYILFKLGLQPPV